MRTNAPRSRSMPSSTSRPGIVRLAAAEVAFGLAQPHGARVAAELERMPDARRDALQHRQVEVDRVPARQHVGIERADALAEERRAPPSRRRSATARSGIGAVRRVDDQHFVDARAHRARSRAALRPVGSVSMSNDSTRGSTSTRAGVSVGLSKMPRDALAAACASPVDLAAALDAALDEVARREAHVGLERVDAGGVQPVAQRRHVGRRRDFDARDGRAGERLAVGRLRGRARRARAARSASAERM